MRCKYGWVRVLFRVLDSSPCPHVVGGPRELSGAFCKSTNLVHKGETLKA